MSYLIQGAFVHCDCEVEEDLEDFAAQVDVVVCQGGIQLLSLAQGQVQNLNQVRESMQLLTQTWSEINSN